MYNNYKVYALVNNKNCVYVGCSKDIGNRLYKHKLDKIFDSHVILSEHKYKKDALLAERSIIKFLSVFGGKELYNAKYWQLGIHALMSNDIPDELKSY